MSEAVQTALIASFSALLGGFLASVSTWILQAQEAKKALRELRRGKLEDIADSLAATMTWYLDMSRSRSIEDLTLHSQSPEARLGYNLACLYFPSLREPIGAYCDRMIEVHNFLCDAFDPQIPITAGAQACRHPQFDLLLDEVRHLRMLAENKLLSVAATLNEEA